MGERAQEAGLPGVETIHCIFDNCYYWLNINILSFNSQYPTRCTRNRKTAVFSRISPLDIFPKWHHLWINPYANKFL
jgi:hypothetical protein